MDERAGCLYRVRSAGRRGWHREGEGRRGLVHVGARKPLPSADEYWPRSPDGPRPQQYARHVSFGRHTARAHHERHERQTTAGTSDSEDFPHPELNGSTRTQVLAKCGQPRWIPYVVHGSEHWQRDLHVSGLAHKARLGREVLIRHKPAEMDYLAAVRLIDNPPDKIEKRK